MFRSTNLCFQSPTPASDSHQLFDNRNLGESESRLASTPFDEDIHLGPDLLNRGWRRIGNRTVTPREDFDEVGLAAFIGSPQREMRSGRDEFQITGGLPMLRNHAC